MENDIKFDVQDELQVFSEIMKDRFGYEVVWNVFMRNNVKRYAVHIFDQGQRYYRLVLGYEHISYTQCLHALYEHMSRYGILGRNEEQIMLPCFHTAKELEMKLELQGK